MTRILFLLLSIAAINVRLLAQSPDEPVENEFKATAVPEKWNNESAVIIGQKTQYIFTRLASGKRYTTVVRIKEYIHKRIKLQDKAALEQFSTFYYVTMGRMGRPITRSLRQTENMWM